METSGGDGHQQVWGIAVEAPVEIALNGTPWTVMLATPADLEDLAVGLATTERVLRDARAVRDVIVSEFLHDISVNLVVPDESLDTRVIRSRSLLSSTACGLCGLESLAELHRRSERGEPTSGGSARGETESDANEDALRLVRVDAPIDDAAILRALAALPSHQPINRATRSVHAAASVSYTHLTLPTNREV